MAKKPQKSKRGRYSEQFKGGTVNFWATQSGRDDKSIIKGLLRAGIPYERDRLYTVRDFMVAAFGDKHAAEVENLQLDAKRKAREEKEAMGELVKFEEVLQRFTDRLLVPLRQRLDSAKATNMARPEWIDDTIRFLREAATKP